MLSRSKYANLAIEGELAVELAREPSESDLVGVGVPACVSRVIPVIELHNHVMRGARPSAGELIANNAIHAGFVAGSGVNPKPIRTEPSLEIFANDRLLDACAGSILVQTIISSLQWLTEILRDRGERLGGGQIILTGSIPGLIPIPEACRLRVDAPPFGSVEAQIV
jgi:2-keto-4-pentenoate hydratase